MKSSWLNGGKEKGLTSSLHWASQSAFVLDTAAWDRRKTDGWIWGLWGRLYSPGGCSTTSGISQCQQVLAGITGHLVLPGCSRTPWEGRLRWEGPFFAFPQHLASFLLSWVTSTMLGTRASWQVLAGFFFSHSGWLAFSRTVEYSKPQQACWFCVAVSSTISSLQAEWREDNSQDLGQLTLRTEDPLTMNAVVTERLSFPKKL